MLPDNKIKLGFSTCPNDTYMFGALVKGMTDFSPASLDLILRDIEVLNRLAGDNVTDITKISFASYPFIARDYQIIHAGAAIGYQNGPLLVSRTRIYPDEIPDLHIAIPGKQTTANLLLGILYPAPQQKTEYIFSDIEDAVMDRECDAGLIIHESRFTYMKKGLQKIADLGETWEKEYDCPVPLGGIVVKRSLPLKLKKDFEEALRLSVRKASENIGEIWKFIRENARELEEEVIKAHIDLYVNDFSLDLGEKGEKAIRILFTRGREKGLLPEIPGNIFLE